MHRPAYARVLTELMAPEGRVLLVTVEHDDAGGRFFGPPYEVSEAQVHELLCGALAVEAVPELRARGAHGTRG